MAHGFCLDWIGHGALLVPAYCLLLTNYLLLTTYNVVLTYYYYLPLQLLPLAQVATTTISSTATATMTCQNVQRTGQAQVLESADRLPRKGECVE